MNITARESAAFVLGGVFGVALIVGDMVFGRTLAWFLG